MLIMLNVEELHRFLPLENNNTFKKYFTLNSDRGAGSKGKNLL